MEPITHLVLSKVLLSKLSTAATAAKCTIIKSGTAKCTMVSSGDAAKTAAAKAASKVKAKDAVTKACRDSVVFTQPGVP